MLSKGTELWTSALQSAGLMAAQRDREPQPSMGVSHTEGGGGGSGGPRAAGVEGAGSLGGLCMSSVGFHPRDLEEGQAEAGELRNRSTGEF